VSGALVPAARVTAAAHALPALDETGHAVDSTDHDHELQQQVDRRHVARLIASDQSVFQPLDSCAVTE